MTRTTLLVRFGGGGGGPRKPRTFPKLQKKHRFGLNFPAAGISSDEVMAGSFTEASDLYRESASISSVLDSNGPNAPLQQPPEPEYRKAPSPTATSTPKPWSPSLFFCLGAAAALQPAPFVGCPAGILGCYVGNVEGCFQAGEQCSALGGLAALCYSVSSGGRTR